MISIHSINFYSVKGRFSVTEPGKYLYLYKEKCLIQIKEALYGHV